MAITGISLIETEEFTSTFDDAPDDQKTVWLLGSVDLITRGMIQDNATAWQSTEGGMMLINKTSVRNNELVRFGLKGFRNFKSKTGSDILPGFVDRVVNNKPYKILDDITLNAIPGIVLNELAERIIAINTATDDLRKK